MSIENLLFEFDRVGTEGINLPLNNKWNKINNINALSNIKFTDDRTRSIKIDVKSIPSPFARMLLFKNAFEDQFFPKELKLDILEDILDLMEFIFLYKNTVYEKNFRVAKVKLSDYESGHLNSVNRDYIKTLNDLAEVYYKDKDSKPEKYNQIDIIYLKNGNENYDNILGGTSPYTAFFTPEEIKIDGEDIPGYFQKYKDPSGAVKRYHKKIDERNPLFLEFLKNFYIKLPYSSYYFKQTLQEIFKDISVNESKQISLSSEVGDSEEMINRNIEIIPGLLYSFYSGKSELSSFYKLRPTIHPKDSNKADEDLPLVLVANRQEHEYYDEIKFPNDWDDILLKARTEDTARENLPGTVKRYRWIYPSDDFFEDKLIKLPQSQSGEKMYTGSSVAGDKNFQYMIPLRQRYFKYFKPEDVDKYLTFNIISHSDHDIKTDVVEVRLKIPIEGNTRDGDYIMIKKIYSGDLINYDSYTEDSKTKAVIKYGTYAAVWPTLLNDIYNRDVRQIEKYFLIQYEIANPLESKWKNTSFFNYKWVDNYFRMVEIKNNRDNSEDVIESYRDRLSKIYALRYPPEIIQMERIDGSKGMFLPRFNEIQRDIANSTKVWNVGIDFGTSNTVIAVKELNDETNEINLMPIYDRNFCQFYGNNPESKWELGEKSFNKVINMYFIPAKLGKENPSSPFGLEGKPFSTEVCYLSSLAYLDQPVLHSNITFKREITIDNFNAIKSNLKWSENDDRNKKLIELFFKELKLIIEKQATENGVSKDKIRYRYSYPLSFDPDQKQSLDNIFRQFKNIDPPIDESQCSAKFFTHLDDKGFAITNPTPAVTIDIGGGTADIVGYVSKEVMFKNSILLGGQDLFNDLISDGTINNPFVSALKSYTLEVSKNNSQCAYVYTPDIFVKYKDSHSLFSYIVSKDEFSYILGEIHNKDFYRYFRLTILYFYSGIVYFIGKNILKYFNSKNLDVKSINKIRVGIGGNGSKLLEWLCRNQKWDAYIKSNTPVFKNFFKSIFEGALGLNDDTVTNLDFTLIQSMKPKEEVVRGLLIEDSDAERLESTEFNNLICGENLMINGIKINVQDGIEKINRNNYASVRFEDFNSSEINVFNKIFKNNFSTYSKALNEDFKIDYIENFLSIFVGELSESNILSEVNLIIQKYYITKKERIKEYNNSYFITELKACIEIIKKSLKSKTFF
jgi:hypothetical protein